MDLIKQSYWDEDEDEEEMDVDESSSQLSSESKGSDVVHCDGDVEDCDGHGDGGLDNGCVDDDDDDEEEEEETEMWYFCDLCGSHRAFLSIHSLVEHKMETHGCTYGMKMKVDSKSQLSPTSPPSSPSPLTSPSKSPELEPETEPGLEAERKRKGRPRGKRLTWIEMPVLEPEEEPGADPTPKNVNEEFLVHCDKSKINTVKRTRKRSYGEPNPAVDYGDCEGQENPAPVAKKKYSCRGRPRKVPVIISPLESKQSNKNNDDDDPQVIEDDEEKQEEETEPEPKVKKIKRKKKLQQIKVPGEGSPEKSCLPEVKLNIKLKESQGQILVTKRGRGRPQRVKRMPSVSTTKIKSKKNFIKSKNTKNNNIKTGRKRNIFPKITMSLLKQVLIKNYFDAIISPTKTPPLENPPPCGDDDDDDVEKEKTIIPNNDDNNNNNLEDSGFASESPCQTSQAHQDNHNETETETETGTEVETQVIPSALLSTQEVQSEEPEPIQSTETPGKASSHTQSNSNPQKQQEKVARININSKTSTKNSKKKNIIISKKSSSTSVKRKVSSDIKRDTERSKPHEEKELENKFSHFLLSQIQQELLTTTSTHNPAININSTESVSDEKNKENDKILKVNDDNNNNNNNNNNDNNNSSTLIHEHTEKEFLNEARKTMLITESFQKSVSKVVINNPTHNNNNYSKKKTKFNFLKL